MYLGSMGMYLTSPRTGGDTLANAKNAAMGIVWIYQTTATYTAFLEWSALPYCWIALSLNVLLTLMISIRLILHARSTRTAMGITGIGRLCNTIVTIFVESCALYTASLSLIIGARIARSPINNLFTCISPGTQVRAFSRRRSGFRQVI